MAKIRHAEKRTKEFKDKVTMRRETFMRKKHSRKEREKMEKWYDIRMSFADSNLKKFNKLTLKKLEENMRLMHQN